MSIPGKNSTAACLWLLMVILDADGKRHDSEFTEIQKCLEDLSPSLADDPWRQPEALMALLHVYYDEVDNAGEEFVIKSAMEQIDDPQLRQQIFVMLMRVAISDKQLHRREDKLLRRIGETWGLEFS